MERERENQLGNSYLVVLDKYQVTPHMEPLASVLDTIWMENTNLHHHRQSVIRHYNARGLVYALIFLL